MAAAPSPVPGHEEDLSCACSSSERAPPHRARGLPLTRSRVRSRRALRGTVTKAAGKETIQRRFLERHEVHDKCLGALVSQYGYTRQYR